MRKIYILFALMMGFLLSQGQMIKSAEYFFGSDPGLGNGIPLAFSQTDSLNQVFSVSVSSLNEGFNNLCVRVKDSLGIWSFTQTKIFYKMPVLSSNLNTPKIKRIEYFVDNDPGLGNANPIAFTTSGDTVAQVFSITVSSLSDGFHTLAVRVQDSLGFWSMAHYKIFYKMPLLSSASSTSKVKKIEYFVDIDPGLGNANPIVFTSLGDSISQIFSIPVSSLSDGFHNLMVRVQDSLGFWSLAHYKIFYKMPTLGSNVFSPKVKKMEYFVDTDPGLGKAFPINFTSIGDSVSQIFSVPVSAFGEGFHKLSVRVQDSLGFWSLSITKIFYVLNSITNLPSTSIKSLEYYFDHDPGLGNGTPLSINQGDTINQILNVPINGLDSGYHYLCVRVKDSIGIWSIVQADTFKILGCNQPMANFSSATDICIGEVLHLTNTSSGVDQWVNYEWDMDNNGTYDFIATGDTNYTYTAPGTYKIVMKATNSSIFQFGCPDTASKIVNVHSLPPTSVSTFGQNPFCQGGNVVLSANPGLGYSFKWLKNDTIIVGATASMFPAAEAGSFSVEITNMYACKDTSNPIAVGIYPLPTAIITPTGGTSFCVGDSLKLNATAGSGLTYIWSKNGTAISGSNTSSIWVNQSGNYGVQITNTNNCVSVASPVYITVNPIPTASISAGGATTLCQGNSVNLYGSNGFGYSYQWIKDGTFINAANSSFYNVTETGQYRVLITNSYLCKDTSASQIITVNPSPVSTITLSGNSTICQGDSVKLSANSGSGLTRQWRNYGINLSGVSDSMFYAKQNGNYSLITTNSYNCSTESSAQSVVVNLVPNASILPLSSTTFCFGDSVKLQANVGAGLTYKWYKNSILISDTLSQIVVKNTGSYSVLVSNLSNCSSISSNVNSTVFAVPTSTFTLQPTACSSDTVLISYTGTASSGAFYNWNFQGGIPISGTGQGPFQVKWSNASGNKIVNLTVNENACTSDVGANAIFIKTILATATSSNTSVCEGDSVTVYANVGQNFLYQWIRDGIPLNGKTDAFVNTTVTGSYRVLINDTVVGCSQLSNPIQVNVNATNFNLAFTASATSFTQMPFSTLFSNQTPNMNNYLFLWDFGDGINSSFYQPSHQYLYNGTYTVALYAENSITGCRDTLVKQNYISCSGGSPNPCNIVAAINPSGPAVICFNDSILLTATSGTNYTYQWTLNGVLISGASGISLYAKQIGSYRVIISNGVCMQNSPPFVLNHFPHVNPVIQSVGTIVPCTNDSMQLHLSNFFSAYAWSNGKATSNIYVSQSGYYSVTVTDNYGCMIPSAPFTVNASILSPPEICIVSVDTSNHNRIIWERPPNLLIDSFSVFRESTIAGVYDKIGTLPYNAAGIFVDTNSNPQVRSYRYKLSTVDTCGSQSLPGSFHKSIHLTINAGLNGSWNLIWDGYIGFPFGSYIIYRGTTPSNMSLLTQLPSSLTSYTDLNPPAGMVYYQIEVLKSSGCYPDSAFAKANTNYNSSRSNTANTAALVPQFLNADFTANATQGVWPIQIQFNDLSSGSPNIWKWSFGDGNSSIEENPKHTYNNTGLYTVRLISCFGTICDTITKVDYINVLPNGMAEVYNDTRMIVYPNPADNHINIDLISKNGGDYQIRLFDAYGRMLKDEKTKLPSGKSTHSFDIENYSAGVYFVIVQDETTRIVRKVVVK